MYMRMHTATDQPKIREYQNFTKARAICKSCDRVSPPSAVSPGDLGPFRAAAGDLLPVSDGIDPALCTQRLHLARLVSHTRVTWDTSHH
jgi:hypothetical protein